MAHIDEIAQHDGRSVTIRGWLHNRRSSGKIHFLIVRDGSGFIQAVMSKATVGEELFQQTGHLSQETAIVLEGMVRADARAPGGYEVDVASLLVVDLARDYPITPRKSLRAWSRCCCMVFVAPSASRLMMAASSRRCCWL